MTDAQTTQNTIFNFEHKVFSVEGCFFAATDGTAALHMRLGDVDVSVSFAQLRSEFEIDKGAPDGRMLALVEDSLRLVRKIRPNDSIPSELLDGTASWSVDDVHLNRAKARLMGLLTAWLAGEEVAVMDSGKVAATLESEETRQMVQRSFADIAEKLGYGRHRRHEIADKVDQFARELSYIEALKDRVQEIARVRAKLNKLAGLHRQDPMLTEELMRMDHLVDGPLRRMAGLIETVYGQTAEIMTILRQFPKLVDYVRNTRDTLRGELIDWDETIAAWQQQPADASTEALSLAKKTYRFLAQNYHQSQAWASNG